MGYLDPNSSSRPVILCFVVYYLPGFRSGGPVRTIANFVDHLGSYYDIRIVTTDHDMGVVDPYPNVCIDEWNVVGKARVFYASRQSISLRGISRLLRSTPHDVLYLNSFFAYRFTILPLLSRFFRLAPRKPCVIAPRGEFSLKALEIKRWKKSLYLFLARLFGLYKGLYWQASSVFESADIKRSIGKLSRNIYVSPNLPQIPEIQARSFIRLDTRDPGIFQLVFLSRISPIKNLHFLLNVLSIFSAPIHLNIYGPIDDMRYWKLCQALIKKLPSHISVKYNGEVSPSNVPYFLSLADLFVLPTKGENFGHVILEALMVGTPVLTSDQTPWRGDLGQGLEELQLGDIDVWRARLVTWSSFSEAELLLRRRAAIKIAQNFLDNPSLIESNQLLFHAALHSSSAF